MDGKPSAEESICADRIRTSSTTIAPKKNWSEDEDIILLRQVSADTPFLAKHGGVMDAWNRLASMICGLHDFSRPNFDGKKAQNRFISLLEKHNDDERVSARASGVSEAYGEKRDVLASLVNDHKMQEASKSAAEKKKKDDEIAAGARAREAAMQSHSDGERASPKRKKSYR